MVITEYILRAITSTSIFLAGNACIFTIFHSDYRKEMSRMMLINALIIGLGVVGFMFLLTVMFMEIYRPLSIVFVFAGTIMLITAIGLVMGFDEQSEKMFDKKIDTEVYFLTPIYKIGNGRKIMIGGDKYAVRSVSGTEFAYIMGDEIVQKDVRNNYVRHKFGGYYKPQVEVTTYKRITEHYRWFLKEGEDIKIFETYELLLPEEDVEYDYTFEDGQYFK